ncbi:hypothetical protein VNO78_17898 [Psophocarpus tetragonolobus]|uniref:Transcription repressor n=1 Tax=Psophocarpus tetragonolobus TaxID=3891 RepID=A0AAN9SID0_PSOTE
MSASRKKLLLNTVSVKLGCSSCRKPMLCRIFHPKPKPKPNTNLPTYQKHKHSSSSFSGGQWGEDKCDSSTTTTTNTNTTTFSPYVDSSHFSDSDSYVKAARTVGGLGRAGKEGVPVEKDSDDPYLDFRHSMLQMILENEIYSKQDLRELLNCFLQLNSPHHHGVIVRAFTEIWNGVFSVSSTSHTHRKPRHF